jgi:hypothetical protein
MKKMKKNWKIASVVVIAVALIAGAGSFVLAQTAEDGMQPGMHSGVLGGHGMHGLAGDAAAVTNLLGLTPDELTSLRAEGKSLAEIAVTKGVSEDALVSAIITAHQEAMQAAVASGNITQEQAALMLQNMEQRVRQMVTSTGIGPFGIGPAMGFGGMGMHH